MFLHSVVVANIKKCISNEYCFCHRIIFSDWTLRNHETPKRTTETATRMIEIPKRNTETAKRNIETSKKAKHRNSETPKHRKYRDTQTKHPNTIFFFSFYLPDHGTPKQTPLS